jgi:hypothetical protein
MKNIISSEELMSIMNKMDKDNSICSIFIPGKGKFTVIFQEEDCTSITSDINSDLELKQMIADSRDSYTKGDTMTTSELIKSLSPEDFMNEK